MPSSTWVHVSDVLTAISVVNPTTVLDVGAGFGKWGYLCREILDIGKQRLIPSEWETDIEGVEPFDPYISIHQRHLYTHVHNMTIQQFLSDGYVMKLHKYEATICNDVLEHMEKEEALQVHRKLVAITNRILIIGLPIGEDWAQGSIFNNPLEEHKSVWQMEDIPKLGHYYRVYNAFCRPYVAIINFPSYFFPLANWLRTTMV